MKNVNKKDILYTALGIIVLGILMIVVVKLVVFDFIIGAKIYDENDIVIRYHRIVNVVTVKNNSSKDITLHYQAGRARVDANGDKRKKDIKYTKRSEVYEINKDEKFTKFVGMFYDAYIFVVTNDDGLNDTASYNKLFIF